MAATIKCEQSQKQEIKEILLKEIGSLMDSIRCDEDDVSVRETYDGLSIEYPMYEVYGDAFGYVDSLPIIFKDLKEKYPNIAVSGLVYYVIETCGEIDGQYFYCKSKDSALTSTYHWQKCAECGKIIAGDAFCNGSEMDLGNFDGYPYCFCSLTCMLKYALDHTEVEFSENLWNRIESSLDDDDYIRDFALLVKYGNLDEEKKNILENILSLID